MLEVGKLDSALLKKVVFEKILYKNPEVLVKANIGEDCAVIDFGQYDCVMSTDPITAAVSKIGNLAIHITCNDIASNGVKPLGIMLVAMLPVGTTEEDIEEIMRQAGETAKQLEVEIIGGHTEITSAVSKPVIVSTAVGKNLRREDIKIKKGDVILMTKSAGLEGIGIIAEDHEDELKKFLKKEEIQKAKNFLRDISVVREGIIGGKVGASVMHDVTEGGILGAIWELCDSANVGAEVLYDNINVDILTKKISKNFNIDYLKLISSGCMLIVISKDKKDELIREMNREGIEISEIGYVDVVENGVKLFKNGVSLDIEPPRSDEIYKVIK